MSGGGLAQPVGYFGQQPLGCLLKLFHFVNEIAKLSNPSIVHAVGRSLRLNTVGGKLSKPKNSDLVEIFRWQIVARLRV
jgi:hypothetical protein